MEVKVYTAVDQGNEFYSIMGPYFADKRFQKLFGECMYNEPNSTWFLAYEDEKLIGFCAGFEKKTHVYLNFFYIDENYQGNGYGSQLFKVRLDFYKDAAEIRNVTKTVETIHLLEKNNFELYGNRGSYQLWRLIKNEKEN